MVVQYIMIPTLFAFVSGIDFNEAINGFLQVLENKSCELELPQSLVNQLLIKKTEFYLSGYKGRSDTNIAEFSPLALHRMSSLNKLMFPEKKIKTVVRCKSGVFDAGRMGALSKEIEWPNVLEKAKGQDDIWFRKGLRLFAEWNQKMPEVILRSSETGKKIIIVQKPQHTIKKILNTICKMLQGQKTLPRWAEIIHKTKRKNSDESLNFDLTIGWYGVSEFLNSLRLLNADTVPQPLFHECPEKASYSKVHH